jgi:hypothetical protein
MNPRAPRDNDGKSAQDERRERQAEALRENLKRRKAQQRARTADPEATSDD